MGINIESAPKLEARATCCVKDFYPFKIELKEIMTSFLYRLQDYLYKAPKGICHEWEKRSYPKGQKIYCKVLDQHYQGVYQGITSEGYLVLEDKDGIRHTISSGDVFIP